MVQNGVVVNPGVVFFSGVVLGRKDVNNLNDYPIIEDNVVLCSGCKVLGKVIIGRGAVIAANAVVFSDCQMGATYVGAPARRIVFFSIILFDLEIF